VRRTLALLGLGTALLSAACASSRMGQAAVRLDQGQPCFGLAEGETRGTDLRLMAVVLSDVSAQPAARVWTLSADDDAQALPMVAGRCVRLDAVQAGYRASGSVTLQPGRVYEVFVNATPAQGRRDAQGYSQRFCLDGAQQLRQLAPDASRCGKP
jgi:hypothetical protein